MANTTNSSKWEKELDDTMKKIMNREKFSYDLNGDALYQQYKDKFIDQGKLAMEDAIGKASSMTGGYGNSYAQSVGQQAYNAQLNNLNNIVPELYQLAYDKYNQQGTDLYNQYSLLSDKKDKELAQKQWKDTFDEDLAFKKRQYYDSLLLAGYKVDDDGKLVYVGGGVDDNVVGGVNDNVGGGVNDNVGGGVNDNVGGGVNDNVGGGEQEPIKDWEIVGKKGTNFFGGIDHNLKVKSPIDDNTYTIGELYDEAVEQNKEQGMDSDEAKAAAKAWILGIQRKLGV